MWQVLIILVTMLIVSLTWAAITIYLLVQN